ncbi:MAG: deaminase [Nanoarchaeota archaeon]
MFYIEHAERDVIFSAIEKNADLNGAIMYCPWFACSDCARAIIRFDFKEIIGHTEPDKFYEEFNKTRERAIKKIHGGKA